MLIMVVTILKTGKNLTNLCQVVQFMEITHAHATECVQTSQPKS